MAFDYDTANTGFFTQVGKVVKSTNARQTTAGTSLPAELKQIADPFEAADQTAIISGLYALYAQAQQSQVQLRQRVAEYADKRLLDPPSTLTPLGLSFGGVPAVLAALYRQMGLDSETVLKCTVALGSITAAGGNVGNGTLLMTKLLDGFNAPVRGGPVVLQYGNVNSELAVNETHQFKVVADTGSGATAGGESVEWTTYLASGDPATQKWDYRSELSGAGPGLTMAGQTGLGAVDDGGLENWGGTGNNTPSTWMIDAGTAGTHVFRESSAPYRGSYAAKLTGDGALAAIKLGQAVSANRVNPLRMYCLSFRLKADATIAAGDLAVGLTGTGYSAGGTETVSVAHGSLPTSWTLKNCFILMPAAIPSDLRLVINWSGTPTSAKSIYLDDVFLTPVTYHGGVGAVAVPGATNALRGDLWTSAVTNDFAGLFQSFFRRQYGAQLPSAAAGLNTIDEALAS